MPEPLINPDPIEGYVSRVFEDAVARLADPAQVETILLDQWPHTDKQSLAYLDQVLACVRDVPRSWGTRLMDLLPDVRTVRTGSAHPRPARLSRRRRAAAEANLRRRLDAALAQGLIEGWEHEAFAADLDGAPHGRLARRLGRTRHRLSRSLLRTRRKLLEVGSPPALVGTGATA